MESKRWLRVRVRSDGSPDGTVVISEETGQAIPHIRRVLFDHFAGNLPEVSLDLVAIDLLSLGLLDRENVCREILRTMDELGIEIQSLKNVKEGVPYDANL